MIEQEVKLAFPQFEAARQAIIAAGGRLVASRRLLEDRLFDLPDGRLRLSGQTLRTRRDSTNGYITFKGPVHPGPVKSREELETRIGDVDVLEAALVAMGFAQVFRAEKYREEYALDAARLAIDDTPFGVFVEIEASPDEIERVARLIGRTPADYSLDSYPTLWRRWCEGAGLPDRDMVFSVSNR